MWTWELPLCTVDLRSDRNVRRWYHTVWNTLFLQLAVLWQGWTWETLVLLVVAPEMEQWSGETKVERKEQLKRRRGCHFVILQPLLHHCLFWMLWPICVPCSEYFPVPLPYWLPYLLIFTVDYTPATDGEEQKNSRESWRLFSGQFWLVWKATPCGGMWLRWQICSDLPPWHQVHRCSTGCESLLEMGRDQTRGSVLLKAQLLVELKEMELWAWLKIGLKSFHLKKGFLDHVTFLVFWHISVGGVGESEWFFQSCFKSI